MKKLFFAFALMFMGTQLMAQSDNDYLELARGVLNIEKKAAVTEVMQLTDLESQPFWTLYNEYQGKLYLVQNKRIDIISDFIENFETLTDEKADELWTNSMAFSQEILKLKKSYYKKFKKILPAGKAALFFQTENKIEALINAQLAIDIPLIETK